MCTLRAVKTNGPRYSRIRWGERSTGRESEVVSSGWVPQSRQATLVGLGDGFTKGVGVGVLTGQPAVPSTPRTPAAVIYPFWDLWYFTIKGSDGNMEATVSSVVSSIKGNISDSIFPIGQDFTWSVSLEHIDYSNIIRENRLRPVDLAQSAWTDHPEIPRAAMDCGGVLVYPDAAVMSFIARWTALSPTG